MGQAIDPIIVFLDVDGVLLPFPDPGKIERGRLFPNASLIALSQILKAFENVGLVLSSTWRVQASIRNQILDDFHAFGRGPLSKLLEFHSICDPEMHTERQHEIYAWLIEHQHHGAWIALDDEELINGAGNEAYKSMFEGHVIHCDSKVGLTDDQATQAVDLLRKQLSQV